MNIGERLNKDGTKKFFYFDLGRGAGSRPSTGIFIYTKPKDQVQRNHNKQALELLEIKKSELFIERQAVGSAYIPKHKLKDNFIDYFKEYIRLNRRNGNRHLSCCFTKFKTFIEKDFIAPAEMNINFCKRFRRFLLDQLTGETPANYFVRFKWVLEAATNDGYYRVSPADKIPAIANPSIALKEVLEKHDYLSLLSTPWANREVAEAFIFCCYTALRGIDVRRLRWKDITDHLVTTRIIQKKTGRPMVLTLHPIAQSIIAKRRKMLPVTCQQDVKVFNLPTEDGANKSLQEWVNAAGINKKITWSCARLSYSVLLGDQNVDTPTIAYLLGHATTKQVERTYKRHRPKNQLATVTLLPSLGDTKPAFYDF